VKPACPSRRSARGRSLSGRFTTGPSRKRRSTCHLLRRSSSTGLRRRRFPILADDQVVALLDEVDGRRFVDRRDSALFRMMLATGLRRAEICGLDLAAVDLDRRVVFVASGKGDRSRFSRFDAETAKRIDRYFRIRAHHRLHGLPALWLTHMGGMTIKGLGTVLARRSAAAGVGHVHPHQLRHTWADRLKRGGMSDVACRERRDRYRPPH
jgi:site-specific recombinase XerD